MNKPVLLLFLLLLTFSVKSQCSNAGFTNPASYSNNSSIGSFSWSNLSNIQLNDNSYATAGQLVGALSSANSNYLVASNFGFSIPTAAVICGITVEVERSASGLAIGASVIDNSVKILKGGATTGTDHASGSAWPSSEAYATYGSSADAWGTTWTPAQINASNFGVAVSAKLTTGLAALFLTPGIDHIRVSVYYNIVVPVTLKSFSAKQVSDKVRLDWVTATEINNRYFLVEKSINSINWSTIDSVDASGNSNDERSYYAYDNHPSPENYYRLKQVDIDGKISLSPVLKVITAVKDNGTIGIYPNPVSGNSFTISLPYNYHPETIEIADCSGRTAHIPLFRMEGQTIKTTLHKRLPPGIYFVRLSDFNHKQYLSGRMIVTER